MEERRLSEEMELLKEAIRGNAVSELVKNKILRREKKPKDGGYHYVFFKEGSAQEQLAHFLFEHYDEHKKTASLEIINQYFPGFKLTESVEPMSYWMKEVRRKRKREKLADGIAKAIEFLKTEDEEGTEKVLTRMMSEIQTEVNVAKDLHWNVEVEERKQAYTKRAEGLGLVGISYAGIEPVDKATGGIQDGQLISIVAMPKTGKTYLEVLISNYAIKAGYRVLFITREMGNNEIATRADVLYFMMNATHYKEGMLSDDHKQKYFDGLDALKEEDIGDFIISGDDSHGYGVSAVQAKIEEYNPDLVIVDGSYLLDDEEGGTAMWEKITNITRKLKRVARKTGKPIIQSSQLSAKTGKVGKANDQSTISFAQSFAQDSDVVIEPFRDEEMKAMNLMGLNLMLVRDGNTPNVVIHWDFENTKNFGKLAEDIIMDEPEEDDGEPLIFA